MNLLKCIFVFLDLLIGGFLILFAGYAYIVESSPWHSMDYFGGVYTILCGIPGLILLTSGILLLKQRRVVLALFGIVFLVIFFIPLLLFKVDSYTREQSIGLGICWLLVGIGYILLAYFFRSKKVAESS